MAGSLGSLRSRPTPAPELKTVAEFRHPQAGRAVPREDYTALAEEYRDGEQEDDRQGALRPTHPRGKP